MKYLLGHRCLPHALAGCLFASLLCKQFIIEGRWPWCPGEGGCRGLAPAIPGDSVLSHGRSEGGGDPLRADEEEIPRV